MQILKVTERARSILWQWVSHDLEDQTRQAAVVFSLSLQSVLNLYINIKDRVINFDTTS